MHEPPHAHMASPLPHECEEPITDHNSPRPTKLSRSTDGQERLLLTFGPYLGCLVAALGLVLDLRVSPALHAAHMGGTYDCLFILRPAFVVIPVWLGGRAVAKKSGVVAGVVSVIGGLLQAPFVCVMQ